MPKLLSATLTFFMLLLWLKGNSQQPVLEAKSFEYIWQKDFFAATAIAAPHVIFPLDDSVKLHIRNSFARAIQDRWNIVMPEISLSVSQLPVFAKKPKFKPRLKDKEPGKWYLFLQVFEKGRFIITDLDTFSTTLELRCRLVKGDNDSVIMDRELTVNIYKDPVPPDQVELRRLPAYPASFVGAFDSIAFWLFQSEPVSQKSLTLKPACVFQEFTIRDKLPTQLSFQSDNGSIHHLTAPAFSFITSRPTLTRMGTTTKLGNTTGGLLTILTGVPTTKRRAVEYRADFPFEDGDSMYHCLIGYAEKETAERERETSIVDGTKTSTVSSSDYQFEARYTDTTFLNVVTLGADTLATFRLRYINMGAAYTNYNRMWDGSDSATIIPSPPRGRINWQKKMFYYRVK